MRWLKGFTVLALLASFLAAVAGPALAQSGGDANTVPSVRIAQSPTYEDKDWTITRMETWTAKDTKTGGVHVHRTVTREGPPGLGSLQTSSRCASPLTDPCTYVGPVSRSDIDTYANSITANVVHYAYKWCKGTNCSIFQAYRAELWWTRSDGTWDARNAITHWGCITCWLLCDSGGTWVNWWSEGPFNPTWNGNATLARIYTVSWPRVGDSSPYQLTFNNTSQAYHNGAYTGADLYVNVPY